MILSLMYACNFAAFLSVRLITAKLLPWFQVLVVSYWNIKFGSWCYFVELRLLVTSIHLLLVLDVQQSLEYCPKLGYSTPRYQTVTRVMRKLSIQRHISTITRLPTNTMAGPYGTRKAVVNNFQRLVGALNKVLEPSCGLDSSEVNPRDIQHLMEGYASKEKEWLKYALEDMSRGYTRNQVDDGNGKSNLVSTLFMCRNTVDTELTRYSWSLSGHLERAVLSMTTHQLTVL